jgi:hypothetical protein
VQAKPGMTNKGETILNHYTNESNWMNSEFYLYKTWGVEVKLRITITQTHAFPFLAEGTVPIKRGYS